jgi:phasin family protein
MTQTRFKLPPRAQAVPGPQAASGVVRLIGVENNPPMAARRRAATEMGRSTIDLTEMFPRMKFPFMPGVEALFAAQRRNIDALVAANKVAMEGARAVAWRNLEIMRQTMADLSEGIHVAMTLEPPRAKTARQAEVIKQAYQNATVSMKEMGEMIQDSRIVAVKVLNTRFTEALEEVKSLVQVANPVS